MQKWSDAGIRKEILQGFPGWLGCQPLVLWALLVPFGILSDVLAMCRVKTPPAFGDVDSGRCWGCPVSRGLGQRDELMLDQKSSEGFWKSRACQRQQDSEGCRSIPGTSQQPWPARGDLLQHRRTPQSCRRRLRKVGSPWHSRALPLCSIPKVAPGSRAGEQRGRFGLDACPRQLHSWHQAAPSSGVFSIRVSPCFLTGSGFGSGFALVSKGKRQLSLLEE